MTVACAGWKAELSRKHGDIANATGSAKTSVLYGKLCDIRGDGIVLDLFVSYGYFLFIYEFVRDSYDV